LPGLASNNDLPNLFTLSSWDYKHAPPLQVALQLFCPIDQSFIPQPYLAAKNPESVFFYCMAIGSTKIYFTLTERENNH
jgi:hypothetical protein